MLQHVSVHAGTIIREPESVPSSNYRYGSTVLVDMCVVSVMAAYSDLCVCVYFTVQEGTFLHGELHTRTTSRNMPP
jgi:hypothetical protein